MRFVRLVLILACCALLVDPPEGESCGPWLPAAQFAYINNPPPEFASGDLGILQPGYFRRNLVVAYRYLSGAPLTADEARAFTRRRQPVQVAPGASLSPMGDWLIARRAVPGAQSIDRIDVERATLVEGKYSGFRNCLDDAFSNAEATLKERINRWGAASPQVKEWLSGQDQVFANCGGDRLEFNMPPPRIVRAEFREPAPLPAGADPLLAADRQYQIAAARFYGGKYKEAADAFRAMAANPDSPWRGAGRYLAARALIRMCTVDGDKSAMPEAETALDEIVRDPGQQRWHASARGLRDYVRGMIRPEDHMLELGETLSKPSPGATFELALSDYTMLWDRTGKGPSARSDLADWITTFQARDGRHAIERWRAGDGQAWLVAALTAVDPADPAAAQLADAAHKVDPSSPAYASAAYHAIRILTARGRRDEARTWADDALTAKTNTATQNAFLSERIALARNWAEFLRYAPRRPVAANSDMADEPIERQWNQLSPAPAFDSDTASAMNRAIPLRLWLEAAAGNALPPRMRTEVAQAGWVRAVILDRRVEAQRFATEVAKLRPELSDAMRGYQSEREPDAARFAAVFAMLRNPGLAPLVRSGFGRLTTPVASLDDLRDNWWTLNRERGLWFWAANLPKTGDVAPAFLSDAQRAEGDAEWKKLEANAGAAPDYLCAQTLAWARLHHDDPRVPEALHLAVRATHYAATGAGTSAWSRRAFQFLHSRYPKSEWAKKTKYWY